MLRLLTHSTSAPRHWPLQVRTVVRGSPQLRRARALSFSHIHLSPSATSNAFTTMNASLTTTSTTTPTPPSPPHLPNSQPASADPPIFKAIPSTSLSSTSPSPDPTTAASSSPPSPSTSPPAPTLPPSSSEVALLLRDDRYHFRDYRWLGCLLELHHIPHVTVIKSVKCKDSVIVCSDPQQRERARAMMEKAVDAEGKAVFKSPQNADGWVSKGPKKGQKRPRPNPSQPITADLTPTPEISTEDGPPSPSPSSPTSPTSRYSRKKVIPSTTDSPSIASLSIVDVVTPYHSLPYEVQLKRKLRQAAAALKAATKTIRTLDPTFTPHHEVKTHNEDILCDLTATLPSPSITGYRNKCEFSVGVDRQGRKTTGFQLGRFVEGVVAVEGVEDCVNVSEAAKKVAQTFTQYLQSSVYDSYDRLSHTGVWRMLTVRNSRQGEVMVIVQIDPTSLSDAQIEAVHENLRQLFTVTTPVHSLYVQHHTGLSNMATSTPLLLHGASYITETLSSLSFRISPSSFFQTNTLGAEVLYSQVKAFACVTPHTTVLDICCGTGTIGQVMAREVKRVIGLELVGDAVADARMNAELNELTNTEYIEGKVEDTMEGVLKQLEGEKGVESEDGGGVRDVVAVVDPPRGGLHGSVVRVLRECEWLKRLIYVSCNPKSLTDNLVTLCQRSSKRVKGKAFIAKQAVAVDMFPHTEHCEMIVRLERE